MRRRMRRRSSSSRRRKRARFAVRKEKRSRMTIAATIF